MKQKHKKESQTVRWIFFTLSLIWMAVIFYFSSQNGDASGECSMFFVELLHIPEWIIRKGAHMAEYAVLAGLLFGFFRTFPAGQWKVGLAAWLVSAGYAATDEFHQMFSGGRTASVRDVCIDAVGAFLGLAVVFAVKYLAGKIKRFDKNKTD